MSDDHEDSEQTTDNPFDKSVHDEPTRKVSTLPHLLRKAGRAPAEIPSSLDEETAASDEASQVPDDNNQQDDEDEHHSDAKDENRGDKKGKKHQKKDAGQDDGEPASEFGDGLQIDIDDSFFDGLFDDEA